MFGKKIKVTLESLRTSKEVEREIIKTEKELPKYKKMLIWALPIGTSFFWLYIPISQNLDMNFEQFLNSNSLLYTIVLWLLWLFSIIIKVYIIKDKSSKRIRELKLRKHILEKEGR